MMHSRSRVAIITAVVAVALVVSLVLFVVSRNHANSTDEPARSSVTIRQRIEILFDAAQQSDVDRYLACFAEPLRSRAKEQLAGDAGALGRSEKELTSFDCPTDVDAVQGDEAVFVVVKIYPETTERVRFRLERIDGEWKIAEMRPLDRNAPETKYGTPVFRLR
jgi:hypothetical protein